MGSVEVHLLRLPVGEEVVPHTLHVHRLAGFIGALECPVMTDFTWGRHVGPSWGCFKVQQNVFRGFV